MAAHLLTCASRRREFHGLAAAVDELPPVGFESRVLAHVALPLPAPPRLPRRRVRWTAAAAAVATLAMGVAR
jgi:hypothetical protein